MALVVSGWAMLERCPPWGRVLRRLPRVLWYHERWPGPRRKSFRLMMARTRGLRVMAVVRERRLVRVVRPAGELGRSQVFW